MNAGRLLVVEDDQRVRESLQRALHLEGFDVTTATDGLEALHMVASDSPDAVILDVIMPYLDGLQVARRIRKEGDPTPILMLTARHEVTHRVADGISCGGWSSLLVIPRWRTSGRRGA